jgi:hypothetical protein
MNANEESEKMQVPAENAAPEATAPRRRLSEILPERFMRRVLEGAGEALDRKLGRVEETPDGLTTPQLIERLKNGMEQRLRDEGRKGRIAPHHIRLKVEWGKHEAAANPALRSLQNELLAAAIDYVNDNRYRTLAPIKIGIESDMFTKQVSVAVDFGDFEEELTRQDEARRRQQQGLPAPADEEDKPEAAKGLAYIARVSRPGIESHELALEFSPGGRRLSVGRGADNDLRLGHSSVSKVHAALRMQESGALIVADTGSTNGTFLNGRRLSYGEAKTIADGDVLGFGEVEVRLRRP